ncbi:MAG: hypothetical protein ACYC26_08445 [Phycisphaerales bacterium]
MRPLLLALVLALIPTSASAAEPDQTPVIQMTISRAKECSPALKYSLMPDLAERINGNAAPLYVTFTGDKADNPLEDESLKNQIADWRDMDDAKLPREQVKQFIADHFQSQLDLLDKAARHTTCDWQYPLEEGLRMILPPLGHYRSLANILTLRIRIAVLEGRYDNAIHDLQTGFALAQQVGAGQTLIPGLVAISIEALMLNEIERFSQRPDAPNLYWALASLPKPLIDLRPVLNWERQTILFTSPYLRQLADGKFDPNEDPKVSEQKLVSAFNDLVSAMSSNNQPDKDSTDALAQNVRNWVAADRDQAIKALLATGMPRPQVEAIPVAQVVAWYWLRQYRRLADDQAKWGLLPYWQAHDGMKAWERDYQTQREKSTSFLTKMIISTVIHYTIAAKPERTIAALQTIESIRDYAATHDGKLPANLDALDLPVPIDPFSGKPLLYHVTDSTFTLESQIPDDLPPKDGLKYQVILRTQ